MAQNAVVFISSTVTTQPAFGVCSQQMRYGHQTSPPVYQYPTNYAPPFQNHPNSCYPQVVAKQLPTNSYYNKTGQYQQQINSSCGINYPQQTVQKQLPVNPCFNSNNQYYQQEINLKAQQHPSAFQSKQYPVSTVQYPQPIHPVQPYYPIQQAQAINCQQQKKKKKKGNVMKGVQVATTGLELMSAGAEFISSL